MQWIKALLEFFPVKEEAFLCSLKLFRGGGITEVRQDVLSNELELFILSAGLVR
jgi:hypothetical protein